MSFQAVFAKLRLPVEAALTVAILLASAGLTAWTWSLPQSLPAARDLAVRQADAFALNYLRREERLQGKSATEPTDAELQSWKEQNPEIFERAVRQTESRFRDHFTYQAPDGEEYVYLGDADSYYWLHLARKLLRTGYLCDPGNEARCLDAQGHAPVGEPLAYPYSLHIYAIAAIHRIATSIHPDYPLSESARLLLVIVASLGVIPAFFIGRLIAGPLGGMIAAFTFALHPVVLDRGLGGDNDVWNLILPLYLVWTILAALSGTLRRRFIFAVLAGAVAGLHATIWSGWTFAYSIVTAGLVGFLAFNAMTAAAQTRSWRIWRSDHVRGAAVTLVVFYVAAGLFASLAGEGGGYARIPLKALNMVLSPFLESDPGAPGSGMAWPNVMRTVSELRGTGLTVIATNMGGKWFMIAGLIGLLLAFFPRRDWRIWHFGLLAASVGFYVSIFFIDPPENRLDLMLAVAAPSLAAIILLLLERRNPDRTFAAALMLLLWFLAAIHLSFGGIRFVLFLAPPFSLALAAGVGRVYQWLQGLSETWLGRFRTLADTAVFLVLATILVLPVSRGLEAARGYSPMINDAWWDSFVALKERSDPESIITVWWDYGHWAKYVADRRVTADGTSLQTHLPHWMAKVLTTSNQRESLGILRMLHCASEVSPLPEGRRGAYGRVKAMGFDDLATYSIVAGLVIRNRAQAEAYLNERGFTAPQRQEILATTHCNPPEGYLVLTSTLQRKIRRLFGLGFRDPRRRAFAKQLKGLPEAEAIDWIASEFGYTRAEARVHYERAEVTRGSLAYQFLDRQWNRCRAKGKSGLMSCPFSMQTSSGTIRGSFDYRPGQWSKGVLHFASPSKNKKLRSGSPGRIMLADRDKLALIDIEQPLHDKIAILLEPDNKRMLVGTKAILASTLVQLIYLDGRFTEMFEKVDEQVALTGERVSTWRINWAAMD